MAAAGAHGVPGRLVDEEIARWRREYQRGRRDCDIAEPAVAAERALRNLVGYGPLQPLLDDPDVWEIMVNGPDSVFVRRHDGPSGYHDEVFHDDDHVGRVLTKVLDDAGRSHRKLDPSEGLQDAQLDTGARLHIVHGDIGRDGHVLVNIRKFTGVQFRQLDQLVRLDMLDASVAAFLRAGVRSGLSVLVAGPPGAGKTTLLSCLAAELDPTLRVVVAEEVFETEILLLNVPEGTCGRRSPPGPNLRQRADPRPGHQTSFGSGHAPGGPRPGNESQADQRPEGRPMSRKMTMRCMGSVGDGSNSKSS